MEDWAGAKAVIDLGIANADEVLEESREDTVQQGAREGSAGNPGGDGLVIRDFVDARSSSPQGIHSDEPAPLHNAPPIVPYSGTLPPSSSLHAITPRVDPDASPSKLRAFAAATQIRLTQMAIVEKIEGADGAAGMWPAVFAWFAANALSSGAGVISAGGAGSMRELLNGLHLRNDANRLWVGLGSPSVDHGDDHTMSASVPRMEVSPASPTTEHDESGGRDKDKEKSGKHLDLHKKLLSKSQRQVHELSRRINPKARRRMSTVSRSASGETRFTSLRISRH